MIYFAVFIHLFLVPWLKLLTLKIKKQLKLNHQSQHSNIIMLKQRIGNQQTQQKRSKPMYYPIESLLPNQQITSNNANSKNNNHAQSAGHFSNPFRMTQLEGLKKSNAELKQKEQLYIQKLMKLQEGLEKQYVQFMTLQQLYTELLQSYKTKEQEIQRLEQLYRQTQRIKYDSLSKIAKKSGAGSYQENQNIQALIKQNQTLKKSYKDSLGEIQKCKNQNSKLKSELIYLKSKQKMNDSMATLESRVLQELQQWQKQLDQEKEDKIKLQYENQYLQERNHDLQKARDQLEKAVLQKQKQITRMRQQKISYVRYNSEQRTSRSPSPTKSISESRRRNRLYDELKKQYQQLKKQMDQLKRGKKNSDSHQLLEIKQPNASQRQSVSSPKSAEFFSFTREVRADFINGSFVENQAWLKQNCQLPNFPPELQIDNLIKQRNK